MFLFYRELEQLVSGMSRPQCRMMAEQVLRDTAPLDCQLTNILSRGQLGEDAQRRVKQLRLVLYHLGRWHNKESESTMQNQTAHVGTVPFVDIVQPRIRECKTKSHSSVRYCSIYLEGVHNVKRFWCTSLLGVIGELTDQNASWEYYKSCWSWQGWSCDMLRLTYV